MSNQVNPTAVTTGQVRLSYAHLFTPYANQPGQEPKFSTTILLPKSDIATKQKIDAAINAAIQAGVSSRWNGTRPPQVKNPIWDGDGVRQNGEPFGPECKGHWVFTASSKQQQAVVDMSVAPIMSQSEVYSGMYAHVNVNFFPYFNSGNKGIGCGLGPIQKIADGEPLGGQISAEAAFGGGSGVYTPPVQPQQQYQQPVQPQAQPYYGQPAQPQQQYGQQPVQPTYQQQPGQPTYPQPGAPTYPQQQYAQPQQQYVAPAQPQQQPAQAQQFDPITGLPITPGGVMGL